MLPTLLVVDDFFGFRHQEFDLSAIHVGVITGRNGAGKSSIFDAIRWALYGRYRESGEQLIRRRASRVKVALGFTARGTRWTVIREKPRGKTGTLHLYEANTSGEVRDGPWDDVTSHTIAETQARIQDLVGLSYAALMAGPVMVQDDERGDLMRLDPRKRKDLIIEEAEVEGYDALFEAAKERVTDAEDTIRLLTRDIEAAREALRHEDAARAALERLTAVLHEARARRDIFETQVTAAKVALAAASETIAGDAALAQRETDLRAALTQGTEDLNRHSATMQRHRAVLSAPHPLPPAVALHTEALALAREQLEQITEARVEQATLGARKAAMRAELAKLPEGGALDPEAVPCHAEGIYATCPLLTDLIWTPERKEAFKAEWATIHTRLGELDVVLAGQAAVAADYKRLDDEDRATREALVAHRTAVEGAKVARESAQLAIADTDASIARVEADLARTRAELDGVVADRAKVAQARSAVDETTAALTVAKDRLSAAGTAIRETHEPAVMKAAFDVEQMDQLKARLPGQEAELAAAHVDRETYTVLRDAYHRDGVPSMVIALLLPLIEARANEVLARMPEEMTLRLLMGEVTKSGTISDRLDIAVTHEGEETAFGMLSGAQQFRVHLALRLGQQRVLAARAGASIDFLLLDEADRDLDEEGVEALIETIAAIKDDFGLILLVSHHEWLIERVPSQIRVTRTHGESVATVT